MKEATSVECGRPALRLCAKSAVLVLILVLGAAPLAAAIPVTSCATVLDTAGAQYVLMGNLSCPAGNPAIDITASGVQFTLAGYTLSGAGTGSVGIRLLNVTNVHVNGGKVTGFGVGILLQGTTESHVNGMTVNQNSVGIRLVNSDDNHINGNYIRMNSITGVELNDSNGNQFNTNVVTDNCCDEHDGGYVLWNSDDNTITSNDVSNNGWTGIYLDVNSSGNIVRGCISNRAQGSPATRTGIVVEGDNNIIQSNMTNNNQYGIWLTSTASGNRVQSNTSYLNEIVDMRDDAYGAPVSACSTNIWKSNLFASDNEPDALKGPTAGCIR